MQEPYNKQANATQFCQLELNRTYLPASLVESPTVAELHAIDYEYRQKALAGWLPCVAPSRFNPSGDAWLPILDAERDEGCYTVMYSNSAKAHELGKTGDWVVIYEVNEPRRCWTVVTCETGPLRGLRLVLGREAECESYHAATAKAERDTSGGWSFEQRAG